MQSLKVEDKKRRGFLLKSVSIIGGAGAAAASWPFIASMSPTASARARGGPIEVNIKRLRPGELQRDKWRGKPIWVVYRTQAMLDTLGKDVKDLSDPNSKVPQQPEYAKNRYRSIKPEYLVLVGICTHLGCSPTFRPTKGAEGLGADWPGGFYCACHGSRFDLSGRVFKHVPAPINLLVPRYRFAAKDIIVIGQDPDSKKASSSETKA